ncbi:hypothetical protein C5E45_09810 [Nocardia nova]|uniref:Uncharacterized protein n=1 Tax=Nocardia nova TaxID=37330 RepID=A0A2S6ATI2_9NOCA|nr:hypothetical protein [Nocardia nova]PPJ23915.1 hypothetical protein C5E41_23325 [Nocardia nova]PPJ38526.1 hypothetical protein C5E45_09810 [Nocardia nova]
MGIRSVWQRLSGRGAAAELDPARTDLMVVVSSFDDAEACSSALARATGWRAEEQALLRHHLRIPAAARDEVVAIAAQDGYSPVAASEAFANGSHTELVLQRVQVLDALHCSQERSRMAGLAQRHEGTAVGWDALQPSGAGPSSP